MPICAQAAGAAGDASSGWAPAALQAAFALAEALERPCEGLEKACVSYVTALPPVVSRATRAGDLDSACAVAQVSRLSLLPHSLIFRHLLTISSSAQVRGCYALKYLS